jgi:hypothetical protein
MALAALFIALGAAVLTFHLVVRAGSGGVAAGTIILSSSLLMAGLGLLLGLYQATLGDLTPWIGAWTAMVIAGVLIAIFIARRGARLPYPRQVAVVASITTLIAVGNFAYTSFYVPSAEPVQLDVQGSMGKPTESADHRFASVPITLSFTNTGKTGLIVIASTYSLVGRKAQLLSSDKSPEQQNLDAQNGTAAATRLSVEGYDVIQSDKFVFEGTEFQPGDKAEANRTVEIATPTPYDVLALNAWVVVVRTNDVRIDADISLAAASSWNARTGRHERDAPNWAAARGIDWALYAIPIEETSYLRAQTRRRWTGYVWRVASDPAIGRPPGSYLSYHFTPSGQPDSEKLTADMDNRVATDRYGLTRSETGVLEKSVYELGVTHAIQM